MSKREIILSIVGILAGIIGSFLFFRLNTSNRGSQQGLIDTGRQVSHSPAPSISVSPGEWQKIIIDSSLSAVMVETFQDASLVRSGTGTILSSDGIIVTTTDIVPYGEYVYQIISDETIYRASVIARDYVTGLALLKVDGSDFTIANLDSGEYESGKELILAGKFPNLSRSIVFSQRALIEYINGKTTLIDSIYNPFLSGGRLLTSHGGIIGIAYLRSGKVYLRSSSDIEDFLQKYLKTHPYAQ